MKKWVNIGGRGFPPMGEPTGEPHLVFWYWPESEQGQYVLVEGSSSMAPTLTGSDGKQIKVLIRANETRHMHVDLARQLWDYVISNGWTIRGSGVKT